MCAMDRQTENRQLCEFFPDLERKRRAAVFFQARKLSRILRHRCSESMARKE